MSLNGLLISGPVAEGIQQQLIFEAISSSLRLIPYQIGHQNSSKGFDKSWWGSNQMPKH
jgi:hypothetical protein